MPASFRHTLRALRNDRSRGIWIGGVCVVVLLAAWLAWMSLAQVPIFVTSTRAHLEVVPAPSPVAAPVTGRVVSATMQVGAHVAAGDVLVELEAQPERVALARARDQLGVLEPELLSIEREFEAETSAATNGDAADRSTVREFLARQRGADSDVAQAEEELARVTALVAKGALPAADESRARAELARKRAALDAISHEIESHSATGRERDAGRRGRRAQLERQRSELTGAVGAARAEVARLELEVARRTIRAPVTGELGSISALRPASVVNTGDIVATVVPSGALHVVGQFEPSAIGRIAPGERARARLDGLPWTRFGMVPLRVSRVANEVRDGLIRIELDLEPEAAAFVLRHGMTGVVDVEVDRVTPATLVLRSLVETRDGAR